MPSKVERELIEVSGREVSISNPRKVLFPDAGITKLDLVHYYLAVADGALRGAGGRPNVLVRYPNGIGDEFFYQKRAPEARPEWIEVVALKFPSGRTAEEVVPRDAAALAWMANLACLELHPHPVLADDLDHPNELRVDLDPVPGVEWRQVQDVARVVRATLDDLGLVGWPKTSGSRGIHVNVRIHQRWSFVEVRRAAVALAREVERRAPAIATSKWWKEERHGVFIDYNQNAKDRTVASAFSVRAASRRARLGAADLGRDRRLQSGRFHAEDHAGVVQGQRRSPRGDRHASGFAGGAPRAVSETGKGRARRCAVAAAIPEDARRTDARAAVSRPQDRPSPASPSRRVSKHPLIEVARSTKKDEALAQLEAWKEEHPKVVALLEPADVLVDSMRGRSSTWTRIRINLQHVPEKQRPKAPKLPPIPNPWANANPEEWHRRPRKARKPE